MKLESTIPIPSHLLRPARLPHTCVIAAVALTIAFSDKALASSISDDFNDNIEDTTIWGKDVVTGHGVLTEKNQRLEYTCASGSAEDNVDRHSVLRFPVNADWEIQIDTFNSTFPTQSDQVCSFGIELLSPHTADDSIFTELYASSLGAPFTTRHGFDTELSTANNTIASTDSGDLGTTNGAIRISYSSGNRVFTVWYDADISDGYQWVQYGSFGIAGSGGTDGNTDWGLGTNEQFSLVVYGFSAVMTISSGQMYGDNFLADGAVPSNGAPDPVGSFHLSFPKGNPLLARIVSIAGNYHGISQTHSQRNYNIDVAQDDSGKLSAMGTIDGIADKDGNTQLSSKVGSLKTVNNEPTVQLKGSFSGSRDGVTTTFSGSAAGPVELVDIGGGTNGINITGSYNSKVGGVPFSGKNIPTAVAAPPDSESNLRQDWSIQLDVAHKQINGKTKTVASAQLLLPNGDTVVFQDRVVRYSVKSGYTLSFTGGTNTTIVPAARDKKSSIAIKGLTFTQEGDNWQPTGGTITYRFFGQKGTGPLTAFLPP